MPGETWTDDELEAAVIAYLQMLKLESAGSPYNKASVVRALKAGPLRHRASVDHRMSNISYVLSQMDRTWIRGYKPLANVGSDGQARLKAIIDRFDGLNGLPIPALPPMTVGEDRKLPPTGYWIFICNRTRWDGEAWLRTGETHLLYMVSKHNRLEMQQGDLGIIRLNALAGSRTRLPKPEGVYAIVEVAEPPREQADDNASFYVNPGDAEAIKPRAKLKILANLVERPVSARSLPETPDFELIRRPLMTSSIPLSQQAFKTVLIQSGVDHLTLNAVRVAGDPGGVTALERQAANLDPTARKRISQVIERGPMGDRVKAAREYRCQLCAALGFDANPFTKRDGTPYAEAHHVQPVSMLMPGSLGEHNIMVLCASHHRQVHYGSFDIVSEAVDEWLVKLDGQHITIEKTTSE